MRITVDTRRSFFLSPFSVPGNEARLAQACPNDNLFGIQGALATCQGNICKCLADGHIHVIFFNIVQFGSLIANSKASNSFTHCLPTKWDKRLS